jgi:hypothetical protein
MIFAADSTPPPYGEQRRREWRDQQLDLGLEVVDAGRDFSASSGELTGEARHKAGHGIEAAVNSIEMLHLLQSARRLP